MARRRRRILLVHGRRQPPTPMSVDTAQFRTAIGQFATGVTIVTTFDGDRPQGITVNALSSVSLDPPLVAIALDQRRFIVPAIEATGRFAINILTEHQQALSDCFAGAAVTPGRDAFCGASWHRGEIDVPVLDGVIAALECAIIEPVPVGDHVLYVGRVEATSLADPEAPPLLYHRRRYLRIERAMSTRVVGKPESPQG
jgi:3-hydroxy-9,10-secoandrosta-1,3,5(10)-triene-9,17-dione monooxygenase reductase component